MLVYQYVNEWELNPRGHDNSGTPLKSNNNVTEEMNVEWKAKRKLCAVFEMSVKILLHQCHAEECDHAGRCI